MSPLHKKQNEKQESDPILFAGSLSCPLQWSCGDKRDGDREQVRDLIIDIIIGDIIIITIDIIIVIDIILILIIMIHSRHHHRKMSK